MIALLDDYDVVVGSRYAPGGKDDRAWLRVAASRLINGLATLVLGGANETPVAVAGGRIYATTVNGNIDSLGLAQ